jgi:hypothetical protein
MGHAVMGHAVMGHAVIPTIKKYKGSLNIGYIATRGNPEE